MDIKTDAMKADGSHAASKAPGGAEDRKLKKACADFEGLLLNYMLESMKKTVGDGGVFKNNFQRNMYESMFTQEVSATLAKGRGVGFGEALYRQLSSRNKSAAAHPAGAPVHPRPQGDNRDG